MAKCRITPHLERWFDGESGAGSLDVKRLGASMGQHLESCRTCAGYLEQLRILRSAFSGAEHQGIQDSQLPAFIEGIRSRVNEKPSRGIRLWSYVSIAAAAMLVAASTFAVLTGGPGQVKARTEVETCSSELDGVTVVPYYSEEYGSTTVWVQDTRGDIW